MRGSCSAPGAASGMNTRRSAEALRLKPTLAVVVYAGAAGVVPAPPRPYPASPSPIPGGFQGDCGTAQAGSRDWGRRCRGCFSVGRVGGSRFATGRECSPRASPAHLVVVVAVARALRVQDAKALSHGCDWAARGS